ncbi:M1 family metallopeptidase [Candidatus Bipolaricaulota bacterium]|nr:M1 family metallopeptidase [Candidatus Bipolaricaulota bacterium]
MGERRLIGVGAAFLISVALIQGLVFGAAIVPSYQIQVRLDTQGHMLLGEESISFTNDTGKTLNRLYLHLYPNRFMDDASIYAREKGIDNYDSIFPAGPDSGYTFIEELELDGVSHDYTVDDTIMRIDLKKSFPPGATIEIYIKFRVKIPDAILRFGHDRGNYYISWWYPRLAAYDEEGWHPYQAHGTSPDEPYDNFAKYQVGITVPQGMAVGATGVRESVAQNPDDTKTLTYTAENVHDFAWVADQRYKVQTASWNGITIRSLYFPEDAAAGKRAAQYAKDALAYFSECYGKYPYKDFTVAETRMSGGAMEYPQLIMMSYQFYRLPNFLTLFDEVIAHETSHQWFYGMLMNDQTNEAWLDEGFATFSEVSYIEHKYGKKGNLLDLNEIKKIPIIGPIAAGGKSVSHIPDSRAQMVTEPYLTAARLGTEAPLLTPRDEIEPGKQPLVYQRGALTLFALKYLVGEEIFDKIIKTYVARYQFKHVTTDDFIRVAEEISGQELGWFFEEWLRSTKHLDYALEGVTTHQIGDEFITRVAIRDDGGLRMPVEVRASLKDGKKVTKRFAPLDRRGTLEFVTEQPVESVVIDPEGLLPDINPANNRLSPPLNISPLVKPGTQKGDGLVVGISFSAPDTRIAGDLGYATGIQRP